MGNVNADPATLDELGRWLRRLFIVIIAVAVTLAVALVGSLYLNWRSDRNRQFRMCESTNTSRAELKESFHLVITGFGTDPRVAALDKRIQTNLAGALPQRQCADLRPGLIP